MRPLDYKELVTALTIDKHTLDDELEKQSAVQHMISEKLSRVREHMYMLENELEQHESDTYIRVIGGTTSDGKKPSVEYTKSMVKVDSIRKKKWIDLNEARAELERWEGLYYAWRARNDALQALAKLAVANYFAVESVHGDRQTRRPIRRRETT